MNSRFFVSAICIVLLFSCDKKESESSSELACYNWTQNSPATNLLSPTDAALVDSLFITNNLNKSNLQVYRTSFSPQSNTTYVKCHQYVNGLKVFSGDLVYTFDASGKFEEVFGDVVSSINLSNTASMMPENLVENFRDSIKADAQIEAYEAEILAECVNLEFGYFDENAASGGATPSYIKLWWLTYDDYGPEMMVDDGKARVYLYFNGIRTSSK